MVIDGVDMVDGDSATYCRRLANFCIGLLTMRHCDHCLIFARALYVEACSGPARVI